MLVVMSVIDLETHLLLDNLTKPTLIAGILLVLFLSGLYGAEDRIWPALIGSALFGGILLLAYRVYPPGLGFGDVKLAPSLGLFVGWLSSEILVSVRLVFFTMIVAFAIGGFGGLAVNLIRRRRAEFPLGPALAVGTVAVIALSSPSVSDLLQQ